jgi:hypothetical protein
VLFNTGRFNPDIDRHNSQNIDLTCQSHIK